MNGLNLQFAMGGDDHAPFPARKTREQICGINLTFQGLTVDLPSKGRLPWFEPGLMCLEQVEDRQATYAAKRAAGDTHQILEFFDYVGSIYDEPGQPYQTFVTQDWEANQVGFLALVEEVMLAGFVPIIVYNGDNGDSPALKSPASGHANAMRQLPILVNLLRSSKHRDLNGDVLYARFWDGIFYGSSPQNIATFGRAFRALLPDGHLALEHQPGRIPCGEGGEDFLPGGKMSTYDVVVAEFDFSNDTPANDTIWQVAGRTIRPYHRPPDQPSGDDPNPPFYLAPGTPRGPYFACAFEWEGAYFWVRGQSTTAQESARRAYLRHLGYTYTG